MNKSFKIFESRLPEEILNQIDAHKIFAMEKQPLDPPAYVQWHQKFAFIQLPLSGVALSWFSPLHESYKNGCSAFLSAFKKLLFSSKKLFVM